MNMTNHPEAILAAEAALPYAAVALVTDHDAGDRAGDGDEHEAVSMEMIMQVVARNVDNVRTLLAAAIPHLP